MSLIGNFLTGTYDVTRSGPGAYVSGEYVKGTTETVKMKGSLQPLNAREMKLVEEGTRLRQYFKFYSDQQLLVVNTKTLNKADVVTIDGTTFKVYSIENWKGVDLPYFKSILYREPEQ